MRENTKKRRYYKKKNLKRFTNNSKVLTYLEKRLIKRKNMQHLIESLATITRANIIRLINKKLNNILRN